MAARDVVLRALARLTRRERTVLALRFYLDLTEFQIAHELGIAPGTVKQLPAALDHRDLGDAPGRGVLGLVPHPDERRDGGLRLPVVRC
jgi:hypothetical protein